VTDGSDPRPVIRVDIWSDVVCPWCYIGKRRFEAAVQEVADELRVVSTYRAYQLDPSAPREPTPVIEAYSKKFGGPAKAREIIDHVTSTAAAAGIEFNMDAAQRANTFDAHRLLWLAAATGQQSALKEVLLRAYFTEGRDIANHDELVSCADAVGLDIDGVRGFLASDDGVGEVAAELRSAAELGITAVPTFVVNGVWSIPGAQDTTTFTQVLRRVAHRAAAT
jgi:predicted DsbA family dithiol-disulfide isomerase